MMGDIHPSSVEKQFLELGYSRFLDLYEELIQDTFWEQDDSKRFYKIKEVYSVYFELIKYPPIQWVIKEETRPNFSGVGRDLFKFIRNILFHFPFFERWDEVWINKPLVNLFSNKPQFIDQYLSKAEGREQYKYRFWEEQQKRMTYISITFPTDYSLDAHIYLKDILTEQDGVKFSIIFMHKILMTQVERQ